jgi:hypothetical protein
MAKSNRSIVWDGARLLWRRRRLLWWLYGLNLLLGLIGTVPTAINVGAVLKHSLAAGYLVKGFDLSFFFELAHQPSHPLSAGASASILLAATFFVLVLLFEGGILEAYRRDSGLTTSEFFEASGRMFWPFVRLLVGLLMALVPVVLIASKLGDWSDKLESNARPAMTGFWVEVAGSLLLFFFLLALRLWFDMAQVRAVAEDERTMRRTLVAAFKLTRGNFRTLFGIYARIGLIAWVFSAVVFWLWVKLVRPEWVGFSFLLSQAVLLVWLAARLWQRASETLWYQHHRPAPRAPWESWLTPEPSQEVL